MATKKQIDANRRNAKKSTGPKTEAGKKRCSQNALKHGMCTRKDVLHSECPEAFNAMRAHFIEQEKPVGSVEQALVNTIFLNFWGMQRGQQMENLCFENLIGCEKRRMNFPTTDPQKELEGLGVSFMANNKEDMQRHIYRYQIKCERAFFKASAELRHKQALRMRQERFAIEYLKQDPSTLASATPTPPLPQYDLKPRPDNDEIALATAAASLDDRINDRAVQMLEGILAKRAHGANLANCVPATETNHNDNSTIGSVAQNSTLNNNAAESPGENPPLAA